MQWRGGGLRLSRFGGATREECVDLRRGAVWVAIFAYLRRVLGYDGLLMVSEPNEMKRQLAKKFGADFVLDPSNGEMGAAVREHTQGGGVEYLIEASGQGRAFAEISSLIRKQATVLLYGHGHVGVELSLLNNVMFKEPCLVTPVGASGGFEKDGNLLLIAGFAFD